MHRNFKAIAKIDMNDLASVFLNHEIGWMAIP
jgi:hypothetical protein